MKRFFIVMMLIASLILSACNHSNSSDPKDTTDTLEENTSRTVELVSNGKANYKIIVSDNCSTEIEKVANSLKNKLKTATGAFFTIGNDYTRDEEVIDSSGEIIIGDCNRTESKNVLSTLTYKDYAVEITDSNIIIAGYESSKVVDAVYSFIKLIDDEYLTVTNSSAVLNWTGNYKKAFESYELDSITIGGVKLSEYCIVYPSGSNVETYLKNNAKDLQARIGKRCGYVLPIYSDKEPVKQYEILLGYTNRVESESHYNSENAPARLESAVCVANGKLLLSGGGWYSLASAILQFDVWMAKSDNGVLDGLSLKKELLNTTIPSQTGDYRFMSYNLMSDVSGYWSDGGIGRSREVDIRKEIVSEFILRYQPTVLALQEVFDNWYEQLPSEIAQDYTFLPLREEATVNKNRANRTMLVYNKHQVKLVEYGYVSAEEKETQNNRVYIWAVFEDLADQTRFAVVGCHFSIDGEDARIGEATHMIEVINTLLSKYDVPVVTMGDYNAVAHASSSKFFLENSGLERAVSWDIDHIYYGNGFEKVNGGTIENDQARYASDHFSIFADLKVKKAS